MKVFFVTLIVLGFVFQNQVVKAQSTNKDVVGTWKYEAPDAPEGFTEGTMVISEKAGALSGVLKLVDGEEMEFGSVEYNEGTLLVTLLVDYNTVSVNCTVKGTSMTGTVDTPDGSLTLTGKKVKAKKGKK